MKTVRRFCRAILCNVVRARLDAVAQHVLHSDRLPRVGRSRMSTQAGPVREYIAKRHKEELWVGYGGGKRKSCTARRACITVTCASLLSLFLPPWPTAGCWKPCISVNVLRFITTGFFA